MTKIAININKLSQTNKRGIGVYIYQVLCELSKIDKRNEYVLYSSFEISDSKYFLSNSNFDLRIIKSKFGPVYWTYGKLPHQIIKDKPDIFFMPIQHASFFLKKPKNIKIITTIHDLAFLLFPKHFTLKDKIFLKINTEITAKISDRIIVPSNATKNDIIKFYNINPKKISVIYHGNRIDNTNLDQSKDKQTNVLNKFKVKKPYILFVGVIQPRKNIIKLIEAFEIIKRKNKYVSLVICGEDGWMANEIHERAEKSKCFDDIIFTGGVSDKELVSFYKNAKIFILPSLYECFGIPVIEAMGLGLPVIVANNSSLCEIAGDAGLFINEYDQNDIAEKISIVLNNEELRKTLSQKGIKRANEFNWRNSAIKHLEIFNNVNEKF